MQTSVYSVQKPLKAKYKEAPELAMVIDYAKTSGKVAADPFHSKVEPMDGCGVSIPVGVHAAVGGLHDAPTPGDLLCAALAACQDSAVRMVANPRRRTDSIGGPSYCDSGRPRSDGNGSHRSRGLPIHHV